MFFLFDCDNFFVSCERIFRPDLKNRPVVVLSSNDGCVVSRSYEAKAIPIAMGTPYFKIEKIFRSSGGIALSANFELYSDISHRIMSLLRQECGDIQIYSVDEAFACLPDNEFNHFQFACRIRNRILKEIGISVSIGIAPSKTLCKIASSVAKSKTKDKIAIFSDSQIIANILKNFEVKDIWGIGRRLAPKLNFLGIFTALELRDAPLKMIRQSFGITIEKTVMELNGHPCLNIEEETAQSITVSRSFQNEISDFNRLNAILSDFTDTACRRLRAQKASAREILVFLRTNRFKDTNKNNNVSYLVPLGAPCIHTGHFIAAMKQGLQQIFHPRTAYKSAGITLLRIEETTHIQSSLFAQNILPATEQKLMQAVDKLNTSLGARTVFFASQSVAPQNFTRSSFRSPSYTTSWTNLPCVH